MSFITAHLMHWYILTTTFVKESFLSQFQTEVSQENLEATETKVIVNDRPQEIEKTEEFSSNTSNSVEIASDKRFEEVIPSNTPQIENQADQYVLADHPSGEEGLYLLKNAPNEPMSTVEELNEAVNQYRTSHNLNQLQIDPDLCTIASQRAEEASVEFSHKKFHEHITNGDYSSISFNVMGENLFSGQFSGVHIVEYAWDKSPGHRGALQGDWIRGCGGIYETTVAFIFAR